VLPSHNTGFSSLDSIHHTLLSVKPLFGAKPSQTGLEKLAMAKIFWDTAKMALSRDYFESFFFYTREEKCQQIFQSIKPHQGKGAPLLIAETPS
jgi:hypothetical protein